MKTAISMTLKLFQAFIWFMVPLSVVVAQIPNAIQTPDDIIKITTKLVQIDAVVVDKDGKPVTDLKNSDFELRQDGKPQKITHLSYVSTASTGGSPRSIDQEIKNPQTPNGVTRNSAGRLIAFVVDDGNCFATPSVIRASREAIDKFLNTMMLPADKVAIYRTRAGSSALQQYTSNKEHLLQVSKTIKYYPPDASCDSYSESKSYENDAERQTREANEDFLNDNKLVAGLGVTNYVVRGLEHVGGRKILFLLSPGLDIRDHIGRPLGSWSAVRSVAEMANRAGVVIDSIDSRGLENTLFIGPDVNVSIGDMNGFHRSGDLQTGAARDLLKSREGLSDLAHLTGGELYYNLNDLSDQIERALRAEKGYYLIAYEPDDETFRGKNFNKIEIKVNRPDVKVISRPGFYGVPDKVRVARKQTENSDLYEAIAAPLPTAGINLHLTAFFGNSLEEGNYVRSLVHLPGDELTFIDDVDGMKKVQLDVVAVTLNEKDEVVDEFTRAHTFKISADAIPFIRQNGLTYVTDVPVKKAGTYNFRVAVRDDVTRDIGTASQIIEIPDLSRGKFLISGLTTAEVEKNGKFTIPGRVKPENAIAITLTTGAPSMRQYHQSDVIAYSYTVYNAGLDKTAGQPNISVQMKLYREGQLVIDGKPEQSKLEKQPDWSRFIDFGYLRLNDSVQPGDYTLQVIVRDLVPGAKDAVSSQSIDFQVLP